MWINKNKYLYLKHKDEDRIAELEKQVESLMKEKQKSCGELGTLSQQEARRTDRLIMQHQADNLNPLLGHSFENPCGLAFAK